MKRMWLVATLLTAILIAPAVPAAAQTLVGPPLPGPVPQPEVIPGQYIVELHRGVPADAVLRDHGLAALERWTIINGFVTRLPEAALRRLTADPRVLSVSPDLVVHAFPKASSHRKRRGGGGGYPVPCPTDLSGATSVPATVPWGVARIGAAPPSTYTGAGVKVAIIDTGIDYCHPELSRNYMGGYNFLTTSAPPQDDNGHGTHVAGIVAAADNDFGVVGVAPGAEIYAVKVLDKNGSGSLSNVISGIDWAATNGMQVANLSLGAVDFWCAYFGLCGVSSTCSAVMNAAAAGVTVVVAAGNSQDDAIYYIPANCADAIAVSALDTNDTFASWFSNYSWYAYDVDGDSRLTAVDQLIIDLMAPGVNVRSTLPTYPVTLTSQYGSNYGTLSGTSMSTPHVAGSAARYLQFQPFASPDDVRQALVSGGDCPGDTSLDGTELRCATKWPNDPDDLGEPVVTAP